MLCKQIANPLPIAAIFVAAMCCADVRAADELVPLDRYAAAAEHFAGRRWSQAVDEFRKFVDEQPDDPRAVQARFFLAESLLHDNNRPDAILEYEKLLKLADDPELAATVRFRLGETLIRERRYKAARPELEAFLESSEKHSARPTALYYLGEVATQLGDDSAARKSLSALRTEFPDDPLVPRAALLETCCLVRLGETQAAWDVLKPHYAKSAEGRDSFIDFLAGSLLATLGDDDSALQAFQTVVDRNDDAVRRRQALNSIAEIHRRHNRRDPYEATLERLIRDDPQQPTAVAAAFQLAESAAEVEDWQAASRRFDGLAARVDLSPEQASRAWIGRAQALAQLREWDEVVAVTTEARRKLRDGEKLYELDYLRGRAHVAKAELNEARAAFADVLAAKSAKETETAALVQFMTAETYFLQHRYDEALTAYRLAATCTFPQWRAAARLQSGKCCEHLGRFADAQADYDAVVRDFADSPYAADAGRRAEACRRQAAAATTLQRK